MKSRHVARRVTRMVAVVCAATAVLCGSWAVTANGTDGGDVRSASFLLSYPPAVTGYYLAGADGGVFAFGDARFHGSMVGRLNTPVVDIERTRSGKGYWLVSRDGGVFAFGDARFYGSMAGRRLNAPVVAIARTPSSEGYWLLGRDGGIFAFGDAGPLQPPLPQRTVPVVDLYALEITFTELPFAPPPGTIVPAPEPPGKEYWAAQVVNADGGTLVGGQYWEDPPEFIGSFSRREPPITLVANIVAVAGLPLAHRFWMAAADGGVFAQGTNYYGSMAGKHLAAPVVDMVASSAPGADGYVLAAADGGVFAFGNAPFLGSMAGKPLAAPIVGMS